MTKKKILLIDDERFPSSYYVKYLEASGRYEVEWVEKVEKALDRIVDPVDAVILDIMMPPGPLSREESKDGIISGVIVLRELRGAQPQVPVFILTNVKDEATLEVCRGFPYVTILTKIEYHPLKLLEELDDQLK